MRHIYFKLLLFLFLPASSFAQQKPVQKNYPLGPVIVNTDKGAQLIRSTPKKPYKPHARGIPHQKPVRKNTTTKNNAASGRNFEQVLRTVKLKYPGGNHFRTRRREVALPVFYPKKESGLRQMKRAWDYESISITTQTDIDNFNTLYPDCSSVGILSIDGAAINDISNLSGIVDAGMLSVKNTALTSLSSMTSLASIADSLVLENNASLTSIGLSNVASLGGIVLRNLPLLTAVDDFKVVDYTHQVSTIVNDIHIENTPITTLAGLSGVTDIGDDFILINTALTYVDMNSLRNAGYIDFEDNSQLTDLGLYMLSSIDGIILSNLPQLTSLYFSEMGLFPRYTGTIWLSDMPALTDISYLGQFNSAANIIILDCPVLTHLDGLQNITEAPYGILVLNNAGLTNIDGLGQITTVEYGTIEISGNNSLTNISGLHSITKADGLWINYNNNLTSLAGLNSALEIFNANGDDLQIISNPQLEVCSVPAICNYLNSPQAFNPQINNNAGMCTDISSILANCSSGSNCTTKDVITWNGSVSEDWGDPINWTPNQVPDECSFVIIPDGTDYEPAAYDDVTIGGLRMEDAYLYMNGYNLTVSDTFQLSGSEIDGYDVLQALNVYFPNINYSYFYGTTLEIKNVMDSAYIYGNSFDGEIIISDNPSRSGMIYVFGNETYGDFTLTNNSDFGNFYLANGNEMEDIINGDLEVNNNSTTGITLGLGENEPLMVFGDVTINQSASNNVIIDKITFAGYDFQILEVPPVIIIGLRKAPVELGPFQIRNLYFHKEYGSYLSLRQDIIVTEQLVMGSGLGVIGSQQNEMLIIGPSATVVDEDPINGSFVQGAMKKIGNTAFTFPLGMNVGTPGFTGDQQSSTTNSLSKRTLYGDFKAPLSISAPDEADEEFVAEYIRNNPANDGYDPNLHEPGVDGIITDEYWVLNRERGSSDVSVTLTYDKDHVEVPLASSQLNITGWDGSQWIAYPKGALTGDDESGTLTTAAPITHYGPLAFFSQDIRTPVLTIGALADTVICKNTSFWVHFNLDTAALEGTIFRVMMSDETGDFSNELVVGSKNTFVSDSILLDIPASWLTTGSHYLLKMTGDRQAIVSQNTIGFTVADVPQQTFSITGPDSVCLNTGVVKYYISDKEDGVTYNWSVTGGTFTVDSDTALVTFTATGSHSVKVTPVNECGSGMVTTHAVWVKPGAPVTAPVLTHTGRWIYASTPPPAEKVTSIKWYRDGSLINGESGNAYYASEAGNFTVEFANDCGSSPASNAIVFANAAIPQTITFDALPDKIYGDAPFELSATASSGLPVVYQLVSGPGNITAGVYTITGTGNVVIEAYQPGNNDYDTAAPVTRSFTINKATQTISWETMPDYDYNGGTIIVSLPKNSSGGIPITYESTSENITLYGHHLRIKGIGSSTITATQAGDNNHLPADPVSHTFCVGVSELDAINGAEYVCPGQEVVYSINKIEGLNYSWTLSDGTVLASGADTVQITWATTGTYQLYVSATGPCGPATPTDSLSITVMDGVTAPVAATNMLPMNGVTDQKLPLVLSWIPGSHTLSYDIFIWEEGAARPAIPFASNATQISYTIARDAGLIYDKVYNWQVVSKNGCLQTEGPVQNFRLRAAPDLSVTEVQAPPTANSGQSITITWEVKNTGAGNTFTNESWTDAVFLSYDTIPNFTIATTNDRGWSQLDFPIKPLLVGTRPNVAALNAGEAYSNSINFTLPLNYSLPLYVYVVTNYKGGADAPPQSDFSNDTARQQEPIQVILTPTPDLRVDTLLAPATTFSGSKINLAYKVTNYGALTPSGSTWKDKVYISKSPLFVKDNALEMKYFKQNETYYPANDAVITNHTLLQSDSSVTRNIEVVIPNFISGTWFIHVVTNEDQTLYEGALAQNNENNRAIQIILTPTPQLSITSLNIPLMNLSTTQTVGINWNVTNEGFFDNIEKNKSSYEVPDYSISCPPQGYEVSSGREMNPSQRDWDQSNNPYPGVRDSLSWGSSYWVDKIYLSTDPNGLNTVNAIYLGQATKGTKDIGWYVPDDIVQGAVHCNNGDYVYHQGNIGNTGNILKPGSNHPNSFSFKMPANLADGDYYFYVQTNATNTVFTYVDTPVVRRSGKVTISRPDLIVSDVTVPSSITGGTPFTLDYTITNSGGGSVYDTWRTDSIFISNSPVFDDNATGIAGVQYTENVPAGTTVSHSVEHTLPNGISGTKYFFVKTNATQAFMETNINNNVSAPAMAGTSTAPPVDLTVTNISVPDTNNAPGVVRVIYTIQNLGDNPSTGETVDSVFISCNAVFDENAIGIGLKNNERNIMAGSSITDTVDVTIPKQSYLINPCFAEADYSGVYFFVKANANHSLYEAGDTTNNVGSSSEKLFANLNVDFEVSDIGGPDSGQVGRPYQLTYDIKNKGLTYSSHHWYDRYILSTDSLDIESGAAITSRLLSGRIVPGQSITKSVNIIIPKIPTGDYYVTVITDVKDDLHYEVNRDNNTDLLRDETGKAKTIHIVQPLLSDLTSAIVTAPTSVAVGQPLTLKYSVTNSGDGITYPDHWLDEIWLATGLKPDKSNGGKRLFAKKHNGTLDVGQSYTDSVTITIPLNKTPGNYMLIVSPDHRNAVIENNDTNNLALKPLLVYVPAPSDLTVANVIAPDTVYLGYTVDSVRWQVQNNSTNPAEGISTDGIYLSKNPVYDSSAILIGLKNKNMKMTALDTDSLAIAPLINNVPEGNYYIIVRTDLLNNISETDKTNNEGSTAQPVYVSVKELKLNETLPDTMMAPRYYKLVLPDSLLGATVLLTLKSEDSLTQRNEMYVGGGYIPSVIRSDYKFDVPNYGNQQILISDITQSVYYVTVRPVSPAPVIQNITLHAVKLPFSILAAQSNRGGNGGNVTVKLTGSLFTDSMTAKLMNGGTTIEAVKVYFINSTVVYATFPLQGKPLGVYDITLTKTDLSEATLEDGFSVVSPDNGGLYATGMNTGPTGPGTQPGCDPGVPAGLNSQLVTELVVPEKVFAGWPFVIQIHFSNPTNMDIPVQTKVLYNDYNVPMAFTEEGVSGGTASLYIEIAESDGPPGVIRAGSSGSITIYTLAPPDAPSHDIIKFNLK